MSRVSLFLFLGLAVAACDWRALIERVTPQDAIEFAKSYIALFRARDFVAIEKKTDPSVQDADIRIKLEKMASVLPDDEPKAITVVGWSKTITNGRTFIVVNLQYEFSTAWLAATVTLESTGNDFVAKGATFVPLVESLQNLNKFTLRSRPLSSYFFLAYAISVAIFVLYAIVAAFNTPIPKRKWLWIAFILVGFGDVTLNWTTGQFSMRLLFFRVLGAGYSSGPYTPVYIFASIPVGAIMFFQRRDRWLSRAAASSEKPATPEVGL